MTSQLNAARVAFAVALFLGVGGGPELRPVVAEEQAHAAARRSGTDWESFLGPGGNSKSSETGLLPQWPDSGPELAWVLDIGEGYSAPAVSRGRLFNFDRVGDRARLTGLEAVTGRELWQETYATDYADYYGYSNGPRTSPVVDEDRVYTYGAEGRLRCHRVTDGRLLWEVDTKADFGVVQNFFGVGSSPVVYGELLITVVGGSSPESPRVHSGAVTGNGSGIVAFDKTTGKVVYRLSDELAGYATPVVSSIDGRPWAFAFMRGGLLGFGPSTGKQDFFFPWRAKVLESVNASTPVVVDDTVFVSESYGPGSALVRVKPSGPEVVWQDAGRRDQTLQTHWNTPVFHEGFLYASSGRNSAGAELRCVRHATGEVMWRQSGLGRATLLYVDDHLLVLSENGELRLIRASPERYQEVAVVDLATRVRPAAVSPGGKLSSASKGLVKRPVWAGPVLANGLLYVRGKDTLVALELLSASTKVRGRKGATRMSE